MQALLESPGEALLATGNACSVKWLAYSNAADNGVRI
jgi:hypothetical protein